MVLKGGVVRHRCAALLPPSGGNGPAQRALEIEIMEALAKCDRGRNRRMLGSKPAIGNAASEECRDDIVAMFFIAGEKAILQQQKNIPEASRPRDRDLIGRYSNNNFRLFGGNQFQALAISVIHVLPAGNGSPSDIGAKLLLQSWRGGEQWSDPVRLRSLGFGDPVKPVREVIILRPEARARHE